jgi:hypothetical protein
LKQAMSRRSTHPKKKLDVKHTLKTMDTLKSARRVHMGTRSLRVDVSPAAVDEWQRRLKMCPALIDLDLVCFRLILRRPHNFFLEVRSPCRGRFGAISEGLRTTSAERSQNQCESSNPVAESSAQSVRKMVDA